MEHPGIVPVYEVGETPEGVPYYTMRFVRGERTLAQAIEAVAGKPMEERLALLEPFLKVCDAVRYAHAHGVIHRDLKPENVALGEFGEAVVLDWGLAKTKGESDARFEPWQQRIEEYRHAADLLTACGDGTARLWLVHPNDLLRLADERLPRDFTPEERERYAEVLGEPAQAGK